MNQKLAHSRFLQEWDDIIFDYLTEIREDPKALHQVAINLAWNRSSDKRKLRYQQFILNNEHTSLATALRLFWKSQPMEHWLPFKSAKDSTEPERFNYTDNIHQKIKSSFYDEKSIAYDPSNDNVVGEHAIADDWVHDYQYWLDDEDNQPKQNICKKCLNKTSGNPIKIEHFLFSEGFPESVWAKLHSLRDQYTVELDKPPFRIVENQVYYNDQLLKKISGTEFEVLLYINQYGDIENYCLKDHKGVWWLWHDGRIKFLTKDAVHFSFYNQDFALDNQYVYLVAKDGFQIPNSDAKSFTSVPDSNYFKDSNQIYLHSSYSGLSTYDGDFDYESLVSTGHKGITDRDNIYTESVGINVTNSKKYQGFLDGAVSQTDENLARCYEINKAYLFKHYPHIKGWWHPDYEYEITPPTDGFIGYYTNEKGVYYIHDPAPLRLSHHIPNFIRIANVNEFDVINSLYGKDSQHVFYRHEVIRNADPKTFICITENLAKDRHHYYFNGNIVDGDYDTFEVIPSESRLLFAKDKNRVYVERHVHFGKVGFRTGEGTTLDPIKGSDPNSFSVLSSLWAKDNDRVYINAKPNKKIDAASLQHLVTVHPRYLIITKDKEHVYCTNYVNDTSPTLIPNADASSFVVLNKYWAKDKNRVYCLGADTWPLGVKDADVESFKCASPESPEAEDTNYHYHLTIKEDDEGILNTKLHREKKST